MSSVVKSAYRKLNLPQFVNVLALTSISSHVRLSSNLTTRNPRKIGLYVKGEGTKLLHVDALAFAKIFVQVCDERLPDDLHL